jgi:hypothetical protein
MRIRAIIAPAALALASAITPAFGYDEATVTGGGSVEGQIVYKGPVQTRKIIPNKDVEVCGGIRDEPLIQVGPNQAVENAVVYLADVAKGKAWPAETSKPAELDNLKCRFVPEVQVIRAGPLVVINSDPVLHNTHGYYGKRTAFNMALPNQGQNSHRAYTSRHRPRRLRRAWLDGRVDLRRRQPLLRDHERRRQIQNLRRAARELQTGGGPVVYRPQRALCDSRRG